MIVVVVIIIVVVIVAAVMYSSKRNSELKEAGKIIDRPSSFWELEELFYTTADFDAIAEEAKAGGFADTPVDATLRPSAKTMDFSHADDWKATLKYQGFRNGEHCYKFGFTSWSQYRGIPQSLDTMNMTQTALEKIFLRADPMCAVETRRGEFKTKTNFI